MSQQYVYCGPCGRYTYQDSLYEKKEQGDVEFYNEENTWQVIRCCGCRSISFLHRNDDYEIVTESSDGDTSHQVTITGYPKSVRNHKALKNIYLVPAIIKKIYTQTLAAYREEAYILAAIGFRAVIEAACNHLGVQGNSLEKRIDYLYKNGYVSNSDKKRLHAIRFLGNDAAHDITEPTVRDLGIALDIVEHLLNSVFILERRSKSLETGIDSYDEFSSLIEVCAKSHEGDQAVTLSGLLGPRVRRLVGQSISQFEAQLQAEVKGGKFPFLKSFDGEPLGNNDQYLYQIVAEQDESSEDSL